MNEYEIQTLGEKRGNRYFYKQGKRLALNGFVPGARFLAEVVEARGYVQLRIDASGDRTVSQKDNGVPVVDINTDKVLAMFQGMDRVRVVVRKNEIFIMALATEARRVERLQRLEKKLAAGEALSVGSVSHGAGIMSHALHAGLAKAGVKARLAFANDIEAEYLKQAQTANDVWDDHTVPVCAPMQEFATDEWAMSQVKKVEILEGGIPCTAASLAGRAKKGAGHPENDPSVGHLIHAFLTIIARANPAVVILENVTAYQNTASMSIYRTMMLDLGYELHERILASKQFGSLENRQRMVAVAVTKGMTFDFSAIEGEMRACEQSVGDILDPIGPDDPAWSPMDYLKKKEERDQAKKAAGLPGTWFPRQEVTAFDRAVPTITRGYIKRRSTDPTLVHPTNPGLLRMFTPSEHARIKGVPAHLVAGVSATRAHEMLGQGVCYGMLSAVGKLVGQFLRPIQLVPMLQEA